MSKSKVAVMDAWSLKLSVMQTFVVKVESSFVIKRSSVWPEVWVGPETC